LKKYTPEQAAIALRLDRIAAELLARYGHGDATPPADPASYTAGVVPTELVDAAPEAPAPPSTPARAPRRQQGRTR
jgi:hypothetical protein